MTLTSRVRRWTLPVVLAAGLAAAAPFAAPAHGQAVDQDRVELLEEFIFYTIVAKPDLAAGYGEELLDSGITDAELADLVDSGLIDEERLERAIDRGLRVESLERIVGELGRRIEAGRLDLAREKDRIQEAIGMLGGTVRQRRLAVGRLVAAGEFAIPYLLDTMTSDDDAVLRQEIRDVIEAIGVKAITPLAVALPEVAPESQLDLVDLLGTIAGGGGPGNTYRHAGPALKALATDDGTTQQVRDAASRAFDRVYGGDDSLSELYGALAEMYLRDLGSLVAYPTESMQNVWRWDGAGLLAIGVPTEIFNEVMAMDAAATSLAYDGTNAESLALYVAANLRRENELPPGAPDPVHGDDRYSPEFYATVFGTATCQRVLAIALDSTDTPLVRDAIEALSKTTGGSNLFSGGARQPLTEALDYPDRRAQLDSALTLARALPSASYEGADRVVPLLASAARTGNEAIATVVAADEENRRVEVARLEALGFSVPGSGASVNEMFAQVGDVPGLDLVVVRMDSADEAMAVHAELRQSRTARVAPVMIVASAVDAPGLELEYRANARVAVRPPLDDEAHAESIATLLRRGAGGRFTDSEAEAYAIEALAALKDIAISSSPAYQLVDAQGALLEALATREGGTRMLVAEILSWLATSQAQQAVFAAALDATDEFDQVDLLVYAADSVKRFGNLVEPRHVQALLRLIQSSEGEVADAAARLHGALNLPTGNAVGFITAGG